MIIYSRLNYYLLSIRRCGYDKMKTKLKMLLAFVLVLIPGVQAFAATGDNTNYSVTIYSGVYAYTDTATNYTDWAGLTFSSGSGEANLTYLNASIVNYSGSKVSSTKTLNKYSNVTFSDVANYSGELIQGRLIKSSINGTNYAQGKFYYDGI